MGDQGPASGGGPDLGRAAAVRCPACGARNGVSADWCTQCYALLAAPGADQSATTAELAQAATPAAPPMQPEQAAAGEVGTSPADAGSGGGVPAAPTAPGAAGVGSVQPDVQATNVRTRDGEVEWRCAVCSGWCALTAPACTVCGAARHGFGTETGPAPPRQDLPLPAVIGVSLVLPGSGHLLIGRTGTGVARLLLALLWLLGGFAMLRGAGGGAALGPALVLFTGAVVVWIGTALDVRTVLTGRGSEVLTSRVLLWLVVGVTVALVATLLLAATVGAG